MRAYHRIIDLKDKHVDVQVSIMLSSTCKIFSLLLKISVRENDQTNDQPYFQFCIFLD